MAYVKTNWQTGDVIDAAKLNNIESGVEKASIAEVALTVSQARPESGTIQLTDAQAELFTNNSISNIYISLDESLAAITEFTNCIAVRQQSITIESIVHHRFIFTSTTATATSFKAAKNYVFDVNASTKMLAINSSSADVVTSFSGKTGDIYIGTGLSMSGNTLTATGTTYTAGTNIQINNNVISATDTTYSAGTGISIDSNVISTTSEQFSIYKHIEVEDLSSKTVSATLSDLELNTLLVAAVAYHGDTETHTDNWQKGSVTSREGDTTNLKFAWFHKYVTNSSETFTIEGSENGVSISLMNIYCGDENTKVVISEGVGSSVGTDCTSLSLNKNGIDARLLAIVGDAQSTAADQWTASLTKDGVTEKSVSLNFIAPSASVTNAGILAAGIDNYVADSGRYVGKSKVNQSNTMMMTALYLNKQEVKNIVNIEGKSYLDQFGVAEVPTQYAVTFTMTKTESPVWSCDKTPTEIIAAVNKGCQVIGKAALIEDADAIFTLSGYGDYPISETETGTAVRFVYNMEVGYNEEKIPGTMYVDVIENTAHVVTCEVSHVSGAEIISDIYSEISTKSEVAANPTLTGSETELTSIKIDDTNYKISNTNTFPRSWPISSSYTCADLLATVGADSTAVTGKTYQGGIALSDLSEIGLGNAEAEIEIISSVLDANDKVIRLNVYSANTEPYSWARMYWWQGSAAASSITPWQITARAADQYTNPVASGVINVSNGRAVFTSWNLSKGMYLVNIYGYQSSKQISYTYYFAYGGYTDWDTYSCDSKGTVVHATGGVLYESKTDGSVIAWDTDKTVVIDMYKMR